MIDRNSQNDTRGTRLTRVCALSDLPPGTATKVDIEPAVAVFNVDGTIYATADLCTHDKSSLSEEGYVDGEAIECAWHFARFCLRTGEALSPPARVPLRTYETHVRDGDVWLRLEPAELTGPSRASEDAASSDLLPPS